MADACAPRPNGRACRQAAHRAPGNPERIRESEREVTGGNYLVPGFCEIRLLLTAL